MENKIKKIISSILIIFLSTCTVFFAYSADNTEFPGINATVDNKDGAVLYNIVFDETTYDIMYKSSGEIIPYNSKLILHYDGEYYAEGQDTSPDAIKYWQVEYEDKRGCVKVSDLKLETDKVTPPANAVAKAEYIKVIGENKINLYEGPSVVYSKLTTIDPGTDLKVFSYENCFGLYTEFNGVKGWLVNTFNSLAFRSGYQYGNNYTGKAVTLNEINMYESFINVWEQQPSANIPLGTEIDFDIYFESEGEIYAYVEYKDKKGWILIEDYSDIPDDIMCESSNYLITTENMVLYEDNNLKPGVRTDKNVDNNQIFYFDWSFREKTEELQSENEWDIPCYEWYRITIDNKHYWIQYNSIQGPECVKTNFASGEIHRFNVDSPVPYYLHPNNDEKEGVIKSGDEYTFLFSFYQNDISWECAEYNNQIVWIDLGKEIEPEWYTITGYKELPTVFGFPLNTEKETEDPSDIDKITDTNQSKTNNNSTKKAGLSNNNNSVKSASDNWLKLAYTIAIIGSIAVIIIIFKRRKKKEFFSKPTPQKSFGSWL